MTIITDKPKFNVICRCEGTDVGSRLPTHPMHPRKTNIPVPSSSDNTVINNCLRELFPRIILFIPKKDNSLKNYKLLPYYKIYIV